LKFGVIGEPCIDYIHREGFDSEKHLGGILYSVVSLAVISKKSDEVYPIMNLGMDEYENVTSFLSKFKNIKLDFINKCSHNTRVVNLYYKSWSPATDSKTYDREESSTEPAFPVIFKQISPAINIMDGILVNMISGVDLTLDTLIVLRNEFKGYMHMDFHNIVMSTAKDGTRMRSPVKNWRQWCSNCDTLQMNESEISAISEEGLNEYKAAEIILTEGTVKALVITRSKQGASLYQKKIKERAGEKYFELDKIDVPSVETPDFKDSTGCGDVFASAFFYKLTENNLSDLSASIHFANRMASRNATLIGPEELHKLND
jgi:hypothetical protein